MIKETEGGTVCKDRRRRRCPARRGRTTSREEDRTARTRRDDGDAKTTRMAGTRGDDGDPEARATREKTSRTSMTGEDRSNGDEGEAVGDGEATVTELRPGERWVTSGGDDGAVVDLAVPRYNPNRLHDRLTVELVRPSGPNRFQNHEFCSGLFIGKRSSSAASTRHGFKEADSGAQSLELAGADPQGHSDAQALRMECITSAIVR
ncbi:hypothetical protein PIB30_098619, partial [Stylosanthes scabra]|nr:hypothetical protein [Stylosanthes scabra]